VPPAPSVAGAGSAPRSSSEVAPRRAALIVAHPGHELRVYHWLERVSPLVLVLTDGSGHTGRSRLASTTALLERVGAQPGPIYGRLTDAELYRAVLSGDTALFTGLVDELAGALSRAGVDLVAGDAVEGYNPGHDVCRLLLNAAVLRLERSGSRPVPANFDFPLMDGPEVCPAEEEGHAIRLRLDDGALERKLAAARAYPEMAAEVEAALVRFGPDAFRDECLRPVRYGLAIDEQVEQPPFYETYGERQVAAGLYRDVIRFANHIAPLARCLARHAARTSG
jgi:hypothetical protein